MIDIFPVDIVTEEGDFPKHSVITESLENHQNNEIFKYINI